MAKLLLLILGVLLLVPAVSGQNFEPACEFPPQLKDLKSKRTLIPTVGLRVMAATLARRRIKPRITSVLSRRITVGDC